MIAEVQSRVGFKEEVSTPPPPRPNGGGFRGALNSAQGTEGTPPKIAGSSADPQNAAVSGGKAAEESGREETATAKLAAEVDSAAAAQRIHLQAALQTPVAVASQAAALRAGEALVTTGETPASDAALSSGSSFAQIGRAAYRAGPHGAGELQFALAAGAQPPGQSAMSGGAAVDQQAQAVLEEAQGKHQQKAEALSAEALTEFRQKAGRDTEGETVQSDPAKLQPERGRQEMLAQLGYATNRAGSFSPVYRSPTEGAGGPVTAPGQGFSAEQDLAATLGGVGGSGAQGTAADRMAAANPGADTQVEPRNLERIVRSAKWLIGEDGTNEVTIKLFPEDLGKMHMKVMQEDGLLRLEMTVQNQAVKQLIESQMDSLREMLLAENLAQGQFQVSVDVRQGDGGPFTSDSPQALAGVEGGRRGNTAAAVAEAAMAADNAKPTWGQGGVGIYA